MRSISVQKLNQGKFFEVLKTMLFQEMTLVVVLKQMTAGTNRRSYAIHIDEWIMEMAKTGAVSFIHDHTSDRLTFGVGEAVFLTGTPEFYLESITCVGKNLQPHFICNSWSSDIKLSEEISLLTGLNDSQ